MAKSPSKPPEDLIPGLPDDTAMECLVRVPASHHPALKRVSHAWSSATSDAAFLCHRRRASAAERLVFLVQPQPDPPSAASPADADKGARARARPSPPLYALNAFNATRREWLRVASLGGVVVPSFAQCVAVPALGKVVVLGGWDPLTLDPVPRVLVIDLLNGSCSLGSPMPTPRSFFACAVAGGTTIYVAGGHDGQKNGLRSAEAYDVVSDEWRTLPPMSEERDESQGFSFDGKKLWVISGYGTESQGRFRSDGEIYDPETNQWSRSDGLWPFTAVSPKFTAVIRGGRWVYLGEGEEREFDWEERTWRGVNLGKIPKRVSGSKSVCLVDLEDDEGVFVMGNGGNSSEEEVFILEERENGKGGSNWDWRNVRAPSGFLGFPFSASQILI